MNLGQLRTQIDRRTGKAQDVAAANSFVNEAVQTIASRREWPWLDSVQTFTIEADVNGFPIPTLTVSDTYSETRIVVINGAEARAIYIADGDEFNLSSDLGWDGWTYFYSVEGTTTLTIYPTPPVGQAVLHRFVRTEPLLVADTQIPLIPERYHTLIADLASGLFLERLGSSRAEYYMTRYESGQRLMYEAVQRSSNPARIRIRPGAAY